MTGRGQWTRDFMIGGALVNAAGVFALVGGILVLDGPGPISQYPWEVGTVLLGFPILGAACGGAAGRLGQHLNDRVEGGWMLLPVGFPVGTLVDWLEMLVVTRATLPSAPDIRAMEVAGATGGGLVLGFVWPLYVVLDRADRPGWAAMVVGAVIAVFAVPSVLWVLEWVL